MKSALFLVVCIVALSMIFISLASANILISGLKDVYNLGDSMNLATKVSSAEHFSGFYRLALVCDGTENLMYFSPMELEKNKDKQISVNFPVARTGSCYILGTLEDERNNKVDESKTSMIVLSDKIGIAMSLNKQQDFLPQENLQLSGTATKANGQAFNGNALVTVDGKSNSATVSNGKFSYSLKLDANVMPGQHSINVFVKDDKNNSGNETTNFSVASVPTALYIETSNNSVLPDAVLMISPKMFDQGNNTLQTLVTVKMVKPGAILINRQETLFEELVDSGNFTLYHFDKYAEPLDYVIEASAAVNGKEFEAKKVVTVERYEKIETNLSGYILKVTNVGNVPFKKQVEIEFLIQGQSTKKLVDIDLQVGESKDYKLEAPQGTYDLNVNTGSEQLKFSQIPLTGSVVAAIDLDKEQQSKFTWIILFVAFIIVLALLSLYIKSRQRRRDHFRSYVKPSNSNGSVSYVKNEKQEQPKTKDSSAMSLIRPMKRETLAHEFIPSSKQAASDKQVVDAFASMYTDDTIKKVFKKHAANKLAAQAVVPTLVYGTKQDVSVLVMSILGLDKLQEVKKKDNRLYENILNEYFSAIVDKIKGHQGVADIYGNNLIVLFNVIKQYRHDVSAIKAAEEIRQVTNELNAHLAKVDMSLAIKAGINTGMAIVTNIGADKEVKYTSIGDTTALARALDRKAIANEILMTENTYDRIANVIKAKKISPLHTAEREAMNVYSVDESSRNELKERHKWYVDRALKG